MRKYKYLREELQPRSGWRWVSLMLNIASMILSLIALGFAILGLVKLMSR